MGIAGTSRSCPTTTSRRPVHPLTPLEGRPHRCSHRWLAHPVAVISAASAAVTSAASAGLAFQTSHADSGDPVPYMGPSTTSVTGRRGVRGTGSP
jgi:hypothetical protein